MREREKEVKEVKIVIIFNWLKWLSSNIINFNTKSVRNLDVMKMMMIMMTQTERSADKSNQRLVVSGSYNVCWYFDFDLFFFDQIHLIFLFTDWHFSLPWIFIFRISFLVGFSPNIIINYLEKCNHSNQSVFFHTTSKD